MSTTSPPLNSVLLEVRDLKVYFPVTSGIILQHKIGDIKAVDGISFTLQQGETLGLVGESGCGKTTTGRCIIQLIRATFGQILYRGQDLCRLKGPQVRTIRRHIQMIFQDPYSSLDPRMTAGSIIGEGLLIHRLVGSRYQYRERVAELLNLV